MGFDVFAMGLLAVFVLLGARRGAVAAGTGLAALVAGYAGGVWAASNFGPALSARLGVVDMLGPPLAGTAGFLVAFTVAGMLGAVLRRIDRSRLGLLPRGGLDRSMGGVFGALRGGMIVILLSLLALWVDAARQLEVSEQLSSLPPLGESRVAAASGAVVERAIGAALSGAGPMAGVAAHFVAHPSESLAGFQGLVEHAGFEELQSDPLFWKYIQHGAIDNALNRESFLRLSQNEDLRENFARLALVSDKAAASPQAFRQAIGEAMAEAGPHIAALSQDRSLERFAEDPEIIELLQSGDTLALITHPKVRALVERVATQL